MAPLNRRPIVVVLLLLLWSSTAGAQPTPHPAGGTSAQPREGTGLILGRVVDGTSGRPVPGAVVSLIGPGLRDTTGGFHVLTDNEGQFLFRSVPAGSMTINVAKGGYLQGAYGRRTPAGPAQPLQLADGQRLGNVTVPIWRVAAIAGTIVDEAGEPVVGVEVRAYRRTFLAGRRGLRQQGQATTDDLGAYRVFNLAPGQYVIAVASATVAVPDDVVAAYQSGLTSNAAAREPLMREMAAIGALGMPTSGSLQFGNLLMNPRGRIMPATIDGRTFTYPTTFYPAAPASAQASLVTVASGEARSGIDIQVRPAPSVAVSGVVTGPDGPAALVAMRLLPSDAELMATELESASTMSDGNGAFRFIGVTPGQYTLKVVKQPVQVRTQGNTTTTMVEVGGGMAFSTVSSFSPSDAPLPAGPTLWESLPISVGRSDVADVAVSLRTGPRVSGRVEFEGTARVPEPSALPQINIQLEPAGGQLLRTASPLRGRIEPTGQFTTVGLPGGRYLLRTGAVQAPWTFKSAMHEGRDLADVPFDAIGGDLSGVVITFTDTPSELNGTVTRGDGAADPDAAVLVFPADVSGWVDWGLNPRRLRTLHVTPTGSFTTSGLPPGDYHVVAVPQEMAADWQDPATLEALAREAAQVRVEDGQKKTQALRTIRGR